MLSQNSLVAESLANCKHLKQNAEKEVRAQVCVPSWTCCWRNATAGGTKKALNLRAKKSLISSHGIFSIQFWHFSSCLLPISPETSTEVAQVTPLLCSSGTPSSVLSPAVKPSAWERHGLVGEWPGEATKMIRGMEHLFYVDRWGN